MADSQSPMICGALPYLQRTPRALFSECGRYRWFLQWPTGHDSEASMLFIGANPSKAGAIDPQTGKVICDPTVARMRNLGRELGYGWLWVVNARSWIATDPKEVPPDPQAIGDKTDGWIVRAASLADLVIVAYGHLAGCRAPRVLELVRHAGKVPHALALTSDGTPRHPRGVPASARPFPLEALGD